MRGHCSMSSWQAWRLFRAKGLKSWVSIFPPSLPSFSLSPPPPHPNAGHDYRFLCLYLPLNHLGANTFPSGYIFSLPPWLYSVLILLTFPNTSVLVMLMVLLSCSVFNRLIENALAWALWHERAFHPTMPFLPWVGKFVTGLSRFYVCSYQVQLTTLHGAEILLLLVIWASSPSPSII